MAGAGIDSFGNQVLWQIISGTGFLRPLNLIDAELNKNKDKLLQGLSHYKKYKTPSGETLRSRKLKKHHHEFIVKLAQFLGLDVLQTHDLFCSYLLTEYKSTQKELDHILNHERSAQVFILKMQEFYHGERLYLLRCLRNILLWLDGEHAYKEAFETFLIPLLDQHKLGNKLLSQFEELCNTPLPTKDLNGPLMGGTQVLLWAHQNLREQAEVLELLLIYYRNFDMDLPTLLDFCNRFKKHGFGWGQSYKHLVDGQMEKIVQRIGYLEVYILLEGMDLLNASDDNNLSEHVILKDSSGMEKLEAVISQLGSEPIHGPILLGWSVLQYIRGDSEQNRSSSPNEAAAADSTLAEPGKVESLIRSAQKFGFQALQLGVFEFLLEMLEAEPFCGKSDLASVAHYLVYSVLSALLSVYHEETLGNTEALYGIAYKLCKWDFIAEKNWMKTNEPEGLTILYESSKQWFPLDFACFVQLNISLASASAYSAQKVKKELLRLQFYTEALDNNRAQDLQTTAEQGVFVLKRDKRPYQNSFFKIEHKTRGTVIQPT
ncbi:hypothetical protein EGW08_016677, partial [Elysia chlorotica]